MIIKAAPIHEIKRLVEDAERLQCDKNESFVAFPQEEFDPPCVSNIPHICHGSHGYIRVNFFWLV